MARVAVADQVICGTFHPDLEVHRRTMAMAGYPEADWDSYDDTGCGQYMVWTIAYRCVDCGRWFHAGCIRRHFSKSSEAPY